MKYIELFAGIGGFRLGIGSNGECAYSNEWDKYSAQTYNKNFGGQIDQRDITTVPTSDIPDHDLLVGGFPCQAFSVAGKRLGFNDTRGTLFFEIARILRDKKPRNFLLENVKGLLSHDEGRTFQTILGVLSDLGYFVEWQVLNSKDFGVPQNRERVFIIGYFGGEPRRKVFPLSRDDNQTTQKYVGSIGTPRDESQAHLSRGHKQPARVFDPSGISPTISSQEPQGRYNIIAPTIRATEYKHGDNQTLVAHTVRNGGQGSPHGSKQNWDSYEFKGRIRRLTPIECERLQGFPDNWTAGVSDTQRYRQLGNAVTTNVVQAVVERLYE